MTGHHCFNQQLEAFFKGGKKLSVTPNLQHPVPKPVTLPALSAGQYLPDSVCSTPPQSFLSHIQTILGASWFNSSVNSYLQQRCKLRIRFLNGDWVGRSEMNHGGNPLRLTALSLFYIYMYVCVYKVLYNVSTCIHAETARMHCPLLARAWYAEVLLFQHIAHMWTSMNAWQDHTSMWYHFLLLTDVIRGIPLNSVNFKAFSKPTFKAWHFAASFPPKWWYTQQDNGKSYKLRIQAAYRLACFYLLTHRQSFYHIMLHS